MLNNSLCSSAGYRLGMESDTIADWQLRAAEYPGTNSTSMAPAIRLNTDLSKSHFSLTPSWRQGTNTNWLEVDLLGAYLIKGLIVQGDGVEQAWTTQLRMEYSLQGNVDRGQSDYNQNPNTLVGIGLGPTLLTLKSFKQKAWLWLADALASANHSQDFC